MNIRNLAFTTSAILLATSISTAHANKVKNLDLTAPNGFSQAPTVKVYSTEGEKWNKVDKNAITKIKLGLSAKCKYTNKGNKIYDSSFAVSGFKLVGKVSPADFLIPHSSEVFADFSYTGNGNTDPVKACTTELTKRLSQNPDKTKYHFLSQGFTVNVPAAFTASYTLTCNPTGLGFIDSRTDKADVNTRVKCLASAKAKNKIPKTPVKAKKMMLAPLVKSVSIKASTTLHRGKCPANIKFTGRITSTRAGEVKYQYIGSSNNKSPIKTLKFTKATTLPTGLWSRWIKQPKASQQLSSGKSSLYDYVGWQRIRIVSPKPMSSSKTNFKVDCTNKIPSGKSIGAPKPTAPGKPATSRKRSNQNSNVRTR